MKLLVTEETVRATAHLARLRLTDAEVAKLTPQLQSIAGYFDALDAVVATAKSEPETTPLRDDRAVDGLSREEALRGAPGAGDRGFQVPQFVGD